LIFRPGIDGGQRDARRRQGAALKVSGDAQVRCGDLAERVVIKERAGDGDEIPGLGSILKNEK
jgi:hypothetical protein